MSKTPRSTQAKTQSSIASFFTKKSATGTPQPAPLQAPPAPDPAPKDSATNGEPLLVAQKRKAAGNDPQGLLPTAGVSVDNPCIPRPAKRVKNNEQTEESNDSSRVTSQTCPQGSSENFKVCTQAEKYIYSAPGESAVNTTIPADEDIGTLENARKEKLHRQWAKKMSNVKIGRQQLNNEDMPPPEEEEGGADDMDETATKTKRKSVKAGKLTPLELQVIEIKRKCMDTLLVVEVGYKFKFFGDDARIAAKELGIMCIPGKLRYDEHPSEAHLDRFASASIPVHRLSFHAKRLVQAGHKIGVVRQVETAALKKAGDNRNAPFTRKLTNVYTKGTYIDDDNVATAEGCVPGTGYLLCLTESTPKGAGTDEKVGVGVLAVQPATGDIIYDAFEDEFLRGEIETRLLHLAPCEILIVGELTKATEKLVQHLSGTTDSVFGDRIRVEKIGNREAIAAEAHSHVSQFYTCKGSDRDVGSIGSNQNLLEKILNLPEEVMTCLSAMITHLTKYGLEHIFHLTKYFESFSMRSHMLLNGNALTSLEIYQNQTEHTDKGSLLWCLDKTETRFGKRLLRKWIGRPLLDRTLLENRINAVEELKDGHQTPKVDKLQSLLHNIKSDLERSLIRIYYGKCARPELLTALQTLQKISYEYAHVKTPSDAEFKSPLLNAAIATLPSINPTIDGFLSRICAAAARKDDIYSFFHPDHESDLITNHKMGIAVVEQELDAHRSIASSVLRKSKPLPYTTVSGIEYLFEVPNSDVKSVPASWIKVSGTKRVSRFHTPEVILMLRERDQHKESLTAACNASFAEHLEKISQHYVLLRDAISALATLDCLLSLARVAQLPGYTKPSIAQTTSINISQGRHPMVELLLPSTYIANTTSLSTAPGRTRTLCITGPNMGGKSSYVRHVALLVLMTQIGSYLPCESASIGLFDAIYTRMGAYDSIFTRQSTFQVELSETASILKCATSRSLVIIDELGRGTSTHDGVAIAESTLEWIVREKKSLCLFITHYQSLAAVAKGFQTDKALKNVYMKFKSSKANETRNSLDLVESGCDDEEITFLYEVGEGVAHRSYGLNVAKLAHVPKTVLDTAARKSHDMEIDVKMRKLSSLSGMMKKILMGDTETNIDQLVVGIDGL